MKSVIFYSMIFAICVMASHVSADIYQWTDDDGIKHFTNIPPPASVAIASATEEILYDEAADLARMEQQRQEQLELDHMALAQREAKLLLREAETERMLAESERQMEETLKEAEDYLDAARKDKTINRQYRYYYPRYYGYSPYFKKRYYRSSFRQRYFKSWNHNAPHHLHTKPKSHISRHNNAGHSKVDRKLNKKPSGRHPSFLRPEKPSRNRHAYRGRHFGKRFSGFKH
jgi:hypothetical protein